MILGKNPFENEHGVINLKKNLMSQFEKIVCEDFPLELVEMCYSMLNLVCFI
jgi:hypothetical protein